jgi:molybdopterin-guanine dinucleotide biosynthesis protein A
MRAAGFVLVGGHSSRMGRDKARLQIGSRLLVEDIGAKVAEAAGRVALVGPPERYADLPFDCLPDLRPHLGPLAGLETALASGRGELNLITGCDMPDLEAGWLKWLLLTAWRTNSWCVVTKDAAGKIHPLCAVYRSECLPAVRSALDAGRLRLVDFIRELRAVEMPTTAVIGNLNTPAQLATYGERPIHALHRVPERQ